MPGEGAKWLNLHAVLITAVWGVTAASVMCRYHHGHLPLGVCAALTTKTAEYIAGMPFNVQVGMPLFRVGDSDASAPSCPLPLAGLGA